MFMADANIRANFAEDAAVTSINSSFMNQFPWTFNGKCVTNVEFSPDFLDFLLKVQDYCWNQGRGRTHASKLRWGDAGDISAVLGRVGAAGFDLLLGADIIYQKDSYEVLSCILNRKHGIKICTLSLINDDFALKNADHFVF